MALNKSLGLHRIRNIAFTSDSIPKVLSECIGLPGKFNTLILLMSIYPDNTEQSFFYHQPFIQTLKSSGGQRSLQKKEYSIIVGGWLQK